MDPTTDYGSWNTEVAQYQGGPEAAIRSYIAHASNEWLSRFDFDGAVTDYRAAINRALPAGVYLVGDEFTGPACEGHAEAFPGYPLDGYGALDISSIVEGVSVEEAVERNHLDSQ